jgi:hypothetical protein
MYMYMCGAPYIIPGIWHNGNRKDSRAMNTSCNRRRGHVRDQVVQRLSFHPSGAEAALMVQHRQPIIPTVFALLILCPSIFLFLPILICLHVISRPIPRGIVSTRYAALYWLVIKGGRRKRGGRCCCARGRGRRGGRERRGVDRYGLAWGLSLLRLLRRGTRRDAVHLWGWGWGVWGVLVRRAPRTGWERISRVDRWPAPHDIFIGRGNGRCRVCTAQRPGTTGLGVRQGSNLAQAELFLRGGECTAHTVWLDIFLARCSATWNNRAEGIRLRVVASTGVWFGLGLGLSGGGIVM